MSIEAAVGRIDQILALQQLMDPAAVRRRPTARALSRYDGRGAVLARSTSAIAGTSSRSPVATLITKS